MLAAFINVSANVGYPLLALLVGAESAGALVPGETALIVAAAPWRWKNSSPRATRRRLRPEARRPASSGRKPRRPRR